MFQHIVHIKKYEHQILYNAVQVSEFESSFLADHTAHIVGSAIDIGYGSLACAPLDCVIFLVTSELHKL